MTAQQIWDAFASEQHIEATYEAWAFGDSPDELAALVLRGLKTGTASAYPIYAREGLPLPRAGEYSVILDSRGHAVCVIRTTKVYVMPFDQVTSAHAFKEGEGDRSLAYWWQVHADFFSRELKEAGLTFTEDMDVVCEEFEMVYHDRGGI